jgi:trigger factor
VEKNHFDVPPSLVNAQLQGMNVPKEEMVSGRDRAIYLVKREIILSKIATQENITVSDQELDSEVSRIAEAENLSHRRLKTQLEKDGRLQNLKTRIRYDKVFKFLVDEASVKSKKVKE